MSAGETAGLITALVALLVSFVSLVVSSRVSRLHATERVTGAFNELLLSAMGDGETRAALYGLMLPEVKEEEAIQRQRLIAYYILNTLQHSFLANERRLMDPGEADPIFSKLLPELLRNPVARDALDRGSYHRDFQAYAHRMQEDAQSRPGSS